MDVADERSVGQQTDESLTDEPRSPAEIVEEIGTVSAPDSRSRNAKMWLIAAIVLILGQMFTGMLVANAGDTITYDETLYVGAAVGYAYDHDVSWSWEHPPLARLLAGVALRIDGIDDATDSTGFADHSDLGYGRAILYGSANDAQEVQFLARLPIMLLTVGFGLVVFAFSRDLWGVTGGLLSVALFSVTPEVLAHGHFITTDMAFAGFLLTALWLLWRTRARGWRYLAPAVLAMGCSLSSKFTSLLFVPIFLGLIAWAVWPHLDEASARRRIGKVAGLVVAGGVGALMVLWTSYLVIDPSLSYDRQPEPAGIAAHGLMAEIANVLPVPDAYRQGLRFAIGAEAGRPAFLLGDFYRGGRPGFFPVTLLIKTPIGALLLWFAGVGVALRRRRRDIALVLGVPAAVMMLSGMTSQLNIGLRHVLPIELFAVVAAGGAVSAVVNRRWQWVAGAALLCTAASTWVAFPNYISYSNEIVGGVGNTYEVLADSNVDWGQDLRRFKSWINKNPPDGPLYFAYFGTAIPSYYGIESSPLPAMKQPMPTSGTIAISASIYNAYNDSPGQYEQFGPPDHVIGGSILVWQLPLHGAR